MLENRTLVDRAAILLGTGLMFLGIVVLGLVETATGRPYGAAPLTNDAGEVVAQPTVDPAIRTGLVVAGLLVLFVWGLYRVVQPTPATDTVDSTTTVQ